MIHDPLLKIDQLIASGRSPDHRELKELRDDMNIAVCLLLRALEYELPPGLRTDTEAFLRSRDA